MKKVIAILVIFLIAGAKVNLGEQNEKAKQDTKVKTSKTGEISTKAYLFTYWVKEDQGLCMAVSLDGFTWQELKNDKPYFALSVGSKLLRDPSICRGPDGTFHLVWTTGWEDSGFGYSSSKDLTNWSEPKFVSITRGILKDGVRNTWAPELFYDEATQEFMIVWASARRKIPGLKTGFKGDHRQYVMRTKDFKSFSDPYPLFGEEFIDMAIIDSCILKAKSQYYVFFKMESDNLIDGGKQGVHWTAAPSLSGPWSKPKPIPGAHGDCEGPTIIQLMDQWVLYWDHPVGAAISSDLEQWQETFDVKFPSGFRHGTDIEIPKQLAEQLLTGASAYE